MENITNATTLNAPVVLTEKVKAIKLIARDALRMELISPKLAEINKLEHETKQRIEYIKAEEKKIAIANYKITRLTRLDAGHPDFDNLKKFQEEVIEYSAKAIENLNKAIEDTNKTIADEKEAISKIETGETKVSFFHLDETVNKLILQEAKNEVQTHLKGLSSLSEDGNPFQ